MSPEIEAAPDDGNDATLTWRGAHYRWSVPTRVVSPSWADRMRSTAFRVVADIHDVTIDWFLADNPDVLCFHAAAVRIGPALLCFPAVSKAGKSTLSAQIVAAGGTFWTDDILPVDPVTGLATSLALPLALRRPLPASMSATTRAFLRRHAGPADAQWRYVRLGPADFAPYGVTARMSAVILLDRRGRGAAKITCIDPADAMAELAAGNLATNVSSHRVLDGLADILAATGCYKLTYSELADASDALFAMFAGPRP